MQRKTSSRFQRILSLLLCAAMVCSYIVLPVGAEAADGVPSEKFSLGVDNIFAYQADEVVLNQGDWVSYRADNGNASLHDFLENEAQQYVDLMPREGKTYWSDAVRETCAKAEFHEDGSVSVVNYYSLPEFSWPYVYTQPSVAIDLELTRWLYFTYEATNYFNVVLDYTYNGTAYSKKPQTSDYSPVSEATTYCVDLHAVTGLTSGKIVLTQCKFYTSGSYGGYVKLYDFGLTSSEAAARTYAATGTGTYLPGYTALMVEYMGTRRDGGSGIEGVEYFVDAVIDCGVDFDEEPHQIKSKTDYGFILYIPDAVMDSLAKKPARGDLIDASFVVGSNVLSNNYPNGTTAAGQTLTFYENPTNTLSNATAADVNATVKLFNYDSTVSREGFNFWNGYWGWGGNVESVDGAGLENGKYRQPVPLNTLSNAGYPQLDNGDGGACALDYLFDGTQTNADGSSALVSTMANGGGLFQMDEDGYFYYDSMQNAAYYDETANKFVLMEDLIVRPWYNANSGTDYKSGENYLDYADVAGHATVYGNFLPFNKITEENVTLDGAVYYNASATPDANGNYGSKHAVDESYSALRNVPGSLERYGLGIGAADKVLAGSKAMSNSAYADIVAANGGEILFGRIEDQLDMGFGMTVDFDFYQPQGGKFNGEDMQFDFLGDDVFVYVGIWTGTVGAGGYFTLTPGQGVTFDDVLQLSGGATHYVVEETITVDVDGQFTVESPECSVNGVSKTVTELTDADGSYIYRTEALELETDESNSLARSEKTQLIGFTNLVNEAKLGTLRIAKKIKEGSELDPNAYFDMRVTIGGKLLQVGTTYDILDSATGAVLREDVEVTRLGYVSIQDGQTAVIHRILSTSTFNVTEITYNSTASYSCQNSSVICTNSGASGVMPLEGDITVLVVNSDGSGLTVDKTVAPGEAGDEFRLTLEAFSTGMTSSLSTTNPADIVLVLDQSASMYTPKGADADRFDRWDSQYFNTNLKRLAPEEMDIGKGAHLGYYVAQSAERNRTVDEGEKDYNGNGVTGESLPIYDWFIVQYVDGIGWVHVRVADTTTPVSVDIPGRVGYAPSSGDQYNLTLVNDDSPGSLIPNLYYYQSQYSALYESVTEFVSDLAASGAEAGVAHRIAITGFSSPYYDGIANYNGTGVYIDGEYYLYDTEYRYQGYATDANSHGYMLYVTEEQYPSMESILPADLENILWSRNLPANAQLIRLDPNQANSAGTSITGSTGKVYTKGQYFAPVPATGELLGYQEMTGERYAQALMPVVQEGAVNAGVSASIEAIRTNYLQTCPAAGLDIAAKIFAANSMEDRDQIVILFTDGVPTVSLQANREYGETGDAGHKETYWSGLSGVKDAVNTANTLKGSGVQIYTIGTSALTAQVSNAANVPIADGAQIKSITGEKFLQYVSSDYSNITANHTVWTVGEATGDNRTDDNTKVATSVLTFYQDGSEITASGSAVQTADIYAKSAADGDFSVAFGEIMKTVSSPNVTLGEEAVLKDTLSDYFDLNTVNPEDIEVYVAPYTGTDANGNHTFGTPVPASQEGFDIRVSFAADGGRENGAVNVSGFSYSEHYVRQDPETQALLGCKLIVKIPIKAREGFWGGNNVPTNKDTTAIYDGSGNQVQPFPMPEANVPVAPAVVANDKTVYYGGNVNSTELLAGITVGGKPVTVGEDGSLTATQDWMDDFATLTWTSGSTVPGYTTVDNKDANLYPYSVTLAPIHDGTDNLSPNPSNMAGAVVTSRTASDEANVYVLVPVITWRDVTINLGDAVGSRFFAEKDFVGLQWVDQDTMSEPTLAPVDEAPTLTYTYSVSGKPTVDTPVDVHVTSSYGNEDITNHVIYDWETCTNSVHMINRDQILKHSGSQVSREFYIHVVGENVLVSDKTISTVPDTGYFELTMEGYVTGSISELHITKPADIVLVLDHSGSMHTPVGATEVLHSPKPDPNNENVILVPGTLYTGAGQLTKAELNTERGIHRGYYVAQSTSSLWWFLLEYDAAADKWIGYSIPSTEAIVNPTGWSEHTKTQRWSYDALPDTLVYYKTQYGVLYDSVLRFVGDLRESGVDHAVSIVGFAGAHTDGTRIYVGGDETPIKTYDALYHDNTTQARRMELFRKAMKHVQDDTQYAQLLSNIEAFETNESFTCPSAGIKLANSLYDANDLDRGGRDRIMILFTDGIPNRGMAEGNEGTMTQDEIYDEIVKEAYKAKHTYGTTLYSVSTTTLGTDANRNFLSYASSDYPNATGYTTPGDPIEVPRYTMQVNGIDSMGIVFDTVTQQVSGTNVKLDETAILRDTLSDYFQLAGTASDITVYTSDYDGNGGWGEPAAFPDARISTSSTEDGRIDTIEVSGFNYSEAYISKDARLKTVTDENGQPTTVAYYGSKLVVKVKVKARDGFWGGNNVPTNESNAGIFGSGGEELDIFPIPEANVPVKPVVKPKDQVVYYGEDKLDGLDLIESVTVGGKPVVYDPETGKFVPGNTESTEDDWMDDFADLSWDPAQDKTDGKNWIDPSDSDTSISGTTPGDYTFGVILTPKPDQNGQDNSAVEGDEYIAGDPVDSTGLPSDPATGSVDVLVPVLTFKDSTINLGDTTGDTYYETTNRQPTVQWVNKEDPYGTSGLPTTPSQGFDTAPSLKLTYTPDTTEEGCFTQDTPVNVEVYLGTEADESNKITQEVYFDWIHCDSDLHDQDETVADDVTGDSTHRHSGTTDSNEFYIHVRYPLNEDTVVIDFGLSVDIAVLKNDGLPQGTPIGSIAKADTVPAPFSKTQDTGNTYGDTAGGRFGALVVNEDGTTLRYTLGSMTMNDKDQFVYMVRFPGDHLTGYCYATVTVIPATSIYFEDNFVSYSVSTKNEDGSYTTNPGGWNEIATPDEPQAEDRPGNALDSLDANNIYGYDGAYTEMTTHSGGTAKWVTVSDGHCADADFTFWGTGFDIISLTDADSGTILVSVKDLLTDEETYYMVDTYYGYKYVDGKWIVDSGDSDTLYQVPVMKVDMKAYSHYQVNINVSWAFWLDHGQNDGNGSYNFYLDAIRIYDPAGDGVIKDAQGNVTDTTIRDAYEADFEANPTYQELRNLLITANDFDSLKDDEIKAGVIFIDGNTALGIAGISDYINYGPNNELYLAPGQAVTFRLDSVGLGGRVHLALKSVGIFGGQNDNMPDGSGQATVEVFGLDDEGNRTDVTVGDNGTVGTATDLYYNITDLAGKTVVIHNTGDAGIISVTNLKTTNTPVATALTVSRTSAALALNALNEGPAAPIAPAEGSISLKYATASFEDEVKLNVYFDTDLDARELGLITFSSQVADATLEKAESILTDVTVNSDGSYSISTKGIAAKNLGDDVWFRVYARLADGSLVYSKLVSYSPKTYAMSILQGNYSTEIKTLVVAMLNYGAAAQSFFGHNTENPVNSGLTAQQLAMVQPYSEAMVAPVVEASADKQGSFTANGGFSRMYPTVSFEGAFSINYYFTPANTPDGEVKLYYWRAEAYENAQVLTADNASGVLTLTDGVAAVEGIAAKELDGTVYVAAVYEAAGERYCSGVLAYSIGAYCAAQAAAGNALAEAVAVYGFYAKAHFGA